MVTSTVLPANWLPLAAVVFALGMRHGLDADHLAAIDALTRIGARERRPLARLCGVFFSLGHGCVVMVIAGFVGALTVRWQTPGWLDVAGAAISIGFLVALGVLNLRAVFNVPADELVALVGLKSRLLKTRPGMFRPWSPAAVGALFALSLDTVSQAALFALAAVRFGGVGHALTLGLAFVLGMVITDGANGIWISRLMSRSDAAARISSRAMSVAVAGLSLLVAGVESTQILVPAFARWIADKGLAVSAIVIAVALGGYIAGHRLARTAAHLCRNRGEDLPPLGRIGAAVGRQPAAECGERPGRFAARPPHEPVRGVERDAQSERQDQLSGRHLGLDEAGIDDDDAHAGDRRLDRERTGFEDRPACDIDRRDGSRLEPMRPILAARSRLQ